MTTFKSIVFLQKSSLGKQVPFPSVPLNSGRCSKIFVFSIDGKVVDGIWKQQIHVSDRVLFLSCMGSYKIVFIRCVF
jgi:hypothetical protein